jgi:hypothetical protein
MTMRGIHIWNRDWMRDTWRRPLCALLVSIAATPAGLFAEPASERTIVQAVADASANRVLVRWAVVEGVARRYTWYDVLRRTSSQSSFSKLNPDPIGPLTTVAAIEAVFTAPGRSDALFGIQASLGPGYAGALLAMQEPGVTGAAKGQLKLLPDQNYGAALALGLGWLDETVLPGTTYVYEVWGLDPQGFRVERLGGASATAGTPPPISAASAACIDMGDARGHLSTFLRWDEPAASAGEYSVGYDVYRARRLPNQTCPPVAPGLPGVVRANQFPVVHDSAGDASQGFQVFGAHCVSCHAGGRDPALPNNLAGKTIAQFRSRQYPELALSSPHNTVDLNTLSPDQLRTVFDWIQEFHFGDDGADTPAAPLVPQEWYCYQVLARNLLGQYGAPSNVVQCQARDRLAPDAPHAMDSKLVTQGTTHETCEISWQRNNGAGDDTTKYRLYRSVQGVPRASVDPAKKVLPPADNQFLVEISQPVSGDKVLYLDPGITPADAGKTFFYAAKALDGAGNASGFSAWVPCVPRDIVPPPAATLTGTCCTRPPGTTGGGCDDRGTDERWVAAGGDRIIISDPARCAPRLACGHQGDIFGCRLYRSFDDQDYLPGADFSAPDVPLDFAPLIDTKIWSTVRTFDRSMNFGPFSNKVAFILKGKNPIPPPRIVSVAVVDESLGRVDITFRSLKPEALLGFALYVRNQGQDDANPPPEQLVVHYHPGSLAGPPDTSVSPPQWTLKATAKPLSQVIHIGANPPPTPPDTYLYYDDIEALYVMRVDLPDVKDLVLRLVGIGWSAQEGLSIPYVWDGWQPGDGVLDWPQFRSDNYRFQGPLATLTVTPAPGQMSLSWTAQPDGCVGGNDRPFIVFRKRGGAARWQQISPPFGCDLQAPDPTQLAYRDTDIEPGLSYTYTVIRLGARGEFEFRHGPATAVAP